VRTAILMIIDKAGSEGAVFGDLATAVGEHLSDEERARLGSLGWHTTVVKLNMEVEGDIARVPAITPQRLVRT